MSLPSSVPPLAEPAVSEEHEAPDAEHDEGSVWGIELVLGGLAAVGPLSIDMYLPAFPEVARSFGVGEAEVQLSLASYFVGLAIGQLGIGPLLDRFGRKRPLLIGLVLYVLAGLACAAAPSLAWLVAARLVQALGGSACMVASRAIVRDLRSGAAAAQMLSRLMLVMGVAPILAPLLGSWVLAHVGWRGIFAVLAGFGVLALVGSAALLPALPAPPTRGSLGQQVRALFAEPEFLRYTLTGSFAMAAMFAYISGSSFVFIEHFGLSAERFAWVFGANAAGLIALSQLNHRLLRHRTPAWMLRAAGAIALLAAFALLAGAGAGLGLLAVAAPLFVYIGSLGAILPNATALALEPHAARAGLASAVMGAIRFGIAFVASAAMAAMHDGTALPMATAVAVFATLAALSLRLLRGRSLLPSLPHL